MNYHQTEVERCDAIEAVHWKEKWMDAQRRLNDLQGQVNRYKIALVEYKAASDFLSASGDNIADYHPQEFEFLNAK